MFVIKKGVFAYGITYDLKYINKIILKGNNEIGRNCKILLDLESHFIMNPKSWLRDNVEINVSKNSTIEIGEQTTIQDYCKLIGNVHVGANTLLAPNVFISSGNHNAFYKPSLTIREQDSLVGNLEYPVFIEEDCWLGKDVFIERGSYIGRGSVIGTGARIKGTIPPYSVVVSQSKILKIRYNFNPPEKIFNSKSFLPYLYRGFIWNESQNSFYCKGKGLIILSKQSSYKKLVLEVDGINNTADFTLNNINVSPERKDNQFIFNIPNEVGDFDTEYFPISLASYNVFHVRNDNPFTFLKSYFI